MNIDYSKLNERIVKQATEIPGFTLSEEQKKQLFNNKIERAAAMLQSRNKSVYHQIED
jgi:hypothetical protein